MRRFSSFLLLALLGVLPCPSLLERPVELHDDTLSAAFSPRALSIQAGGHEATLALVRAGCAEAPRVVAPVAPVLAGGRVVYRHEDAGVEQWFVKEPRGIEQGFTFQGPPQGCASAALRLDMEAGGDLSPAMDEARKRVVFRDASGTARLSYSELRVVDGAGRTLPSAMGLEDGRLALHVDTSDAVYPVVVDPLIGVPGQFISGLSSDYFFGNAVAVDGPLAAIGAPDDDDRDLDAGAVYLFALQGGKWEFRDKLVPPVAKFGQSCGTSVAMKGGVLLVGCPGGAQVQVWDVSGASGKLAKVFPEAPGSFSNFGRLVAYDGQRAAVYDAIDGEVGTFSVYDKQSLDSWPLIDSLSGATGQSFASSMVISGDRLSFGVPYDEVYVQGKVQVWDRSGGLFENVANLAPLTETGPAQFGAGLATDGISLFIGAPGASGGQGRAWVASPAGANWQLTELPGPPAGLTGFGTAVALDGDRLAVLAAGISSGVQALGYSKQGASWGPDAQPFSIHPGGGNAAQASPIFSMALGGGHLLVGLPGLGTSNNPPGAQTGTPNGYARFSDDLKPGFQPVNAVGPSPGTWGDFFGSSIALDGNWLLVGAPRETIAKKQQGAATLFEREKPGEPWVVLQSFGDAFPSGEENHLGAAVAMGGGWAFVGVPGKENTSTGEVLVFRKEATGWIPKGSLTTPSIFGLKNFGNAIALDSVPSSGDLTGVTLAVGAYNTAVSGNGQSGMVALYQYEPSDDEWVSAGDLTPPGCFTGPNNCGQRFGEYLALSKDLLLVSAPVFGFSNGSHAGRVHAYRRQGALWQLEKTILEPEDVALGFPKNARYFGLGLAVDAKAKVAFINANSSSGVAGPSFVYAFETDTWTNTQRIDNPAGSLFFGTTMTTRDGTLAVSSTTTNQGKGNVFFYRKPANTWDLVGRYDGIAFNSGRAIALDQDNTVVVGAHGEKDSPQYGSVTVVKLLLDDGSVCTAAAECASGFCVDGVCCDAACDGACQACTTTLKGSGDDGVCGNLTAGTPDTACQNGGDVCGTTGLCNDAGACALVAAQTPCGKSCGDPGAPALIDALCDGLGTCAPGAPSSCGNYACAEGENGAQCLTSCELPEQCAPGNVCVGGQCVGPLGNGAACKENAACASKFCVDGVCCDAACDGACQACAASLGASADGACTGTCANGLCVDDTCQPAGGAGGAGPGGSAGDGGAAGGPGKGLPDLWKDQEAAGGGSGVPGGAGGSAGAGAGGVYQRPKASALPLVLRDEDDGCGCRVAGAASPSPTASLAWLSVLGLLVCRRNRRP